MIIPKSFALGHLIATFLRHATTIDFSCVPLVLFRYLMRSKKVCQTGIIRTRFSAADFRLNRVIRLANTVKY